MAHAHAQSLLGADKPVTPCYSLPIRKSFSIDEKEVEKKRSLRNEKLKADRTSETEEKRKESLRIRREKDRARRRTKGKKRSPDTDDYEKQRLATLKRLKQVKLT